MNPKTKTTLTIGSCLLMLTALPLLASAPVLAYGPGRATYTINQPADHITFNSITNNSLYGDERNFVTAKPVSDGNKDTWTNVINVVSNQEYYVRLYVHNNAAENLNLVAQNTRVYANVPTALAKTIQLDGAITADNASPNRVWDDVVFQSQKMFSLAYVAGSARYYNNHFTSGVQINDSLITKNGAQVGYNAIDGKVQGCFKYSGHLVFKVKATVVENPKFTIAKQVRKLGDKIWSKNITAKAGDKVEYRLTYKNTGTVAQNNVIAKDFMAQGLVYQNNSLKLYNAANQNGLILQEQNDLFNNKGKNIGNYGPNANAGVYYTVQLPNNDQLKICGKNIFRNRAVIYTEHGNLEDLTDVVVEKTNCQPTTPTQPNNPNKPNNPEALPKTGPMEVFISTVGVLLITASVVYWYKSQQELKRQLLVGYEMKITDNIESDLAKTKSKSEKTKN